MYAARPAGKKVFALRAEAGLFLTMTGWESLVRPVLKRIGKKTDQDANRQGTSIFIEPGIHACAGFPVAV